MTPSPWPSPTSTVPGLEERSVTPRCSASSVYSRRTWVTPSLAHSPWTASPPNRQSSWRATSTAGAAPSRASASTCSPTSPWDPEWRACPRAASATSRSTSTSGTCRRLEALATSSQGRAQLELDLTEWSARGRSGPERPRRRRSSTTYLAAVPGNLLADLYGRYGSRLLESNVRSFLSGRGNVNKGIRTTILSDPAMFLAYNNGDHRDRDRGQDRIRTARSCRLRDLQIVNGGQTTASLFYVRRDSHPSRPRQRSTSR